MPLHVAHLPSRSKCESVLTPGDWSLGNQVLYDLCARFPDHGKIPEIVAKVWLIGRAYAAPVERGRPGGTDAPDAEAFYVNTVGPAIHDSGLDDLLTQIPNTREPRPAPEHIALALETHRLLTETVRQLTGRAVRSFSSKYLHFHRPHLFPIYDSRANQEIRKWVGGRVDRSFPAGDPEYRSFFARALVLQRAVSYECGLDLDYRQIDRLLLGY